MAKQAAPSLLDRCRRAPDPRGPRCGVAKLLDQLDERDRLDLTAALADTLIEASKIARVLHEDGHRIGADTLRRHRKGACSCADDR